MPVAVLNMSKAHNILSQSQYDWNNVTVTLNPSTNKQNILPLNVQDIDKGAWSVTHQTDLNFIKNKLKKMLVIWSFKNEKTYKVFKSVFFNQIEKWKIKIEKCKFAMFHILPVFPRHKNKKMDIPRP